MLFTVIKYFLLLILFVNANAEEFDRDYQIPDPFLGIAFGAKSTKLEPLQDDVAQAFKLDKGRYWLFAYYLDSFDNGNEYYIINGVHLARSTDGNERWVVDEFGKLGVVKNKKYLWLATPERLDDIGLPERVQIEIAKNAVMRLIDASGGLDKLQREIDDRGGVTVIKPIAQALRAYSVKNIAVLK